MEEKTMSLFNSEKKKAPTCCCGSTEPKAEKSSCCCSAPKAEASACCCGTPVEGICCVKVLGAGCKSCHAQYENAKAAVQALGLNVEVEYITDILNSTQNYPIQSGAGIASPS